MFDIFSFKDIKTIEKAVTKAEALTSAEIKPVIINYCWGNLHLKARQIFEKYDLHKTQNRNAVMILIVVKNRELLIFGDEGITQKAGLDFWIETKDKMIDFFRKNEFLEGLLYGIDKAGEKLAEFFPVTAENANELSNEVIYEK